MSSQHTLPPDRSPNTDRKQPPPSTAKHSLFSKLKIGHKHKDKEKDKHPPPSEPQRPPGNDVLRPTEPTIPASRNISSTSNKNYSHESAQERRDRETSIASVDSASTIRPPDPPMPKMERTFTAASKSSRFTRHGRNRGPSVVSETSQRTTSSANANAMHKLRCKQASSTSIPTSMIWMASSANRRSPKHLERQAFSLVQRDPRLLPKRLALQSGMLPTVGPSKAQQRKY